MEFFKKNEEVIDLVLTPKGRELLARGEFKPSHYSFHDIDIRYESNTGESQNQIVPRIKDAQRLKGPTYYSGADYYRKGIGGSVNKKHYLANKIGDKKQGDNYAPAWKIKFKNTPNFQNFVYNGDLKTSNYYVVNLTANTFSNIIENEGLEELIPQININFYYKIVDVLNFVNESDEKTKYFKSFLLEDKDILAEIEEINSFEENDDIKFNLEIYMESKQNGELLQLDFKKLVKDEFSVEKYLNVKFDNDADFEEFEKLIDIYGPGGRDTPTSCE